MDQRSSKIKIEKGGESPFSFSSSDLIQSIQIETPSALKKVSSPIKWAGGKRWLLPKLLQIFPTEFDWYIEPFAGGASAFFGLAPSRAILADLNPDLITTYGAIRDEPNNVWLKLSEHARRHSDTYFYEVRSSKPRLPASIAARFLYLNRTCWNGLFRVNQRGEFNVPRGTKNAVLLPTDNPPLLSKTLKNTELIWSDFEMPIDCAGRGDLVYVDPPYTVKHNFNGFVKYNEFIFSWSDQERLARSLRRARKRGAFVVVSNADHPSVRSLYEPDFVVEQVARNSVLSGDADFRCLTSELLIIGSSHG